MPLSEPPDTVEKDQSQHFGQGMIDMVLAVLAAIGAVWLFWSAMQQSLLSEATRRGACAFLCVCLGLVFATAPGEVTAWVTNAVQGSLALCAIGFAASVVFARVEMGNAFRVDSAAGVPALRPHWPSGLVAALWFAVCVAGAWLIGQGIQSFEASVLTPLLTALDPAQANSPDVVHAIEVITVVMMTLTLAAVVLVFALPLTMGYLHHRRVRSALEIYNRELRDYYEREPLPTGSVAPSLLG